MINKSLIIKVVLWVNDDGSPYLKGGPFLKVYNQQDEQEEILIIASSIGVWVNPKIDLIKIYKGGHKND